MPDKDINGQPIHVAMQEFSVWKLLAFYQGVYIYSDPIVLSFNNNGKCVLQQVVWVFWDARPILTKFIYVSYFHCPVKPADNNLLHTH